MDESKQLPPNAVEATPSRLLQRVAANEQSAWQQLVRLYGPIVRFWIRRNGLQRQDVADIFQDVFVAVSANIGRFERKPGEGKFRAWLKTVVQSKVADHFRKAGKNPDAVGGSVANLQMHQISDGQDASSDVLPPSEDAVLMQRTLHLVKSEFSDQYWQAFWRITIDGRSSQEVAEELGMSPAAVRKAKSRVMQRLRQELDEFGDPLLG